MMKQILKKLNATLMTMAISTMVMLPIAQGKQAAENFDKVTKSQLEEAIIAMGLNKSMTFGEFYKKNKDNFPPRVQKMMEQMVSRFKDEPMPQFEVYTTQNSKGEQIANVRITGKSTGNKQLSNVQFLGEPNKFAKFDNTNLTEEDIANFDDMFVKLYVGDASHRKGMGDAVTSPKTLKKSKKTSAKTTFQGYPKITKELWKKWTPMERARFMVNLRLLWSGAQDVLDAKEAYKSKGKKTSSLDGSTSPLQKWNLFFAMLNDAVAAPGDKDCVIAGYIGYYDRNKCQYPEEAKSAGCTYPCNPTIYGRASGGKPFCLENRAQLQTATHYKQGCDAKMPLSSVEMSLPAKASAKDSSRYNDVIESNKAQALADPQSLALTKKYLESMLQDNSELADAFRNGNLTPNLVAELTKIQSEFDSTIEAGRTECAAAASKTQYDPNFWGACDQLHKRFLFVAAYLEKTPGMGCKDGGSIDPRQLTCSCPSGPVAVGSTCGPAQGNPNEPAPGGDAGDTTVTEGSDAVCDPACGAKQKCVPDGEFDGVKAPGKCVSADGSDSRSGKEETSFWGKIWNGVKKAAPWVLGAGAVYLLWKHVFKVKKPSLNPAGDRCPNGTIPPCGQICTPPQAILSSGACGCPACPPGQSLTNASSCLCETTTSTTTIYVCADGVTQVTDLANCPTTTTYTCWDGSTVSNPINCPEQPVSKPVDTTR
jgi:hypothetical protein